MNTNSLMRTFNPKQVAYYEKENYVAYYQKRWLRLLRASVGMVKEAFGLSWPQAVYAAYLVARAEIAFAPFPNNDVPLAEAYMRRFYAFIKKVHNANFDVAEVARLDVKWWEIHRRLFGNPQNQELVDAVAALYAVTYGVEPERVRQALHGSIPVETRGEHERPGSAQRVAVDRASEGDGACARWAEQHQVAVPGRGVVRVFDRA